MDSRHTPTFSFRSLQFRQPNLDLRRVLACCISVGQVKAIPDLIIRYLVPVCREGYLPELVGSFNAGEMWKVDTKYSSVAPIR